VLLIDAAGRIVHANAALLAAVPHDPLRLVGHGVFDALPELVGTLAEAYLRRALTSRDTALFDMASPFHDRAWLRCRLAPVGEAIALLISDVTRDVLDLRESAARHDITRALAQNDDVAAVRLSARASIEGADSHFAAWVDSAEARLIGRPFCDLIDGSDRLAVRAMLEAVIGRREEGSATARLLARSTSIAARIGATCSREPHGDAGAVLVLSRIDGAAEATQRLRQVN
jgi:hypothetical protein